MSSMNKSPPEDKGSSPASQNKPSVGEPENHNELLNFTNLLQNLPYDDSVRTNNEKDNLDLLLQQYQTVLEKSNPASNHTASAASLFTDDESYTDNGKKSNHKISLDGKSCNSCARNKVKCVFVPDLGSCLECETLKIKCIFSPIRKRLIGDNSMDKNAINNEKQLKKTKSETNTSKVTSRYYTNFLQSLNSSASTPATSQISYEQATSPVGSNLTSSTTPYMYQQTHNQSPGAIPSAINGTSSFLHAQKSMPVQHPRSSFYVGLTSIYDINIINKVKLDNIDQIKISKNLSLRKVSSDVQFLLRDDYVSNETMAKDYREIDYVERLIYPNGKTLIDIFFKLVHPYFPILHERVFLEKYSRSYRELPVPLLSSIYSLSLQWWDFHPQLIGFPKPDAKIVEQLNSIAYRSYFEMIENPKLSLIQSGLLILLTRGERTNNWLLSSNLVALAEELGLGINCDDWKLPKWEKDLRKRLAWAVFSQDKWTSLIEGRISYLILGRNWLISLLKQDEFPVSSPAISSTDNTAGNMLIDMNLNNEDYHNATLLFQQKVSLSIIIGEIMDTFYTQGAMHVNNTIENVLKQAKPLQLKLREWYHSLPKQLSMNNFKSKKFNSNAALNLSYFAAEIALHRKIISTLKTDSPNELYSVCRAAAKTRLIASIEFLKELKNEHIFAFWYSNASGNIMSIGTFAALLYVTSPNKEEADYYKNLTRNYIWVLRIGSKTFDKFQNALNNIHLLLAQIPGLLNDEAPPKPQLPSQSSNADFRSMSQQNLFANGGSQQLLNQVSNMSPTIVQSMGSIRSQSTGGSFHTSPKNNDGSPMYVESPNVKHSPSVEQKLVNNGYSPNHQLRDSVDENYTSNTATQSVENTTATEQPSESLVSEDQHSDAVKESHSPSEKDQDIKAVEQEVVTEQADDQSSKG
ncbi:hypothetical protein KAFR_0A00220 [Kazachstania africana CBS 2517]|uniref:Zn(2)-C6 fungal-type domain-containing protein n=1 Tax=Kazachstania africana (strain ATCC 22294 / BCRC 22015 / CBS 2517 / CECT 1963 / NBRC 1671 / NRRL Y-8276) TaxID=1071382 RepID=H2AM60_KAZAF|nr:hypothetical protein KAFR_0A00220 [Kazachstania africana CBS 2517]CCF55460.1 hypothetical protein KAFR_0A00220 [Kazachstania africana CBS 2517]